MIPLRSRDCDQGDIREVTHFASESGLLHNLNSKRSDSSQTATNLSSVKTGKLHNSNALRQAQRGYVQLYLVKST
ncbi:hypothetical protein CSC82_00690 [Rhodobacteraceae bacterium 4F10]|nr:hypothetical protein CSC82_00690 [Rhodobacteraceae bacterium 4F10]